MLVLVGRAAGAADDLEVLVERGEVVVDREGRREVGEEGEEVRGGLAFGLRGEG